MIREAWTLAIEALSWMELKRLNERLAIAKTSKQLGIKDPQALGLAYKMVCETVRKLNLIDHIINSVLKPRSIEDFRLGVKAFLRLYTHEIHFEKAKFEEAVEMAKTGRAILGWKELHKAEGILGEIYNVRIDELLKGLSDEERVSLVTCTPLWFVKYCFKAFGRTEALKLLESTCESTPTYIRINTLRGPEERLLRKIEREGIVLRKVEHLRYAYKVVSTEKPLLRSDSYLNGLFYIQDMASCLAVEVAEPQPRMTVLDVCAAPGAKTSFLAQLMDNKGVIYSIDYSRRRLGVWRKQVKRMGVKIAHPILGDTRNPLPLNIKADLVVLDPPCTSTGTFAKVPSAKWRLSKRSPLRMAKIQWEMLLQCGETVKPGGSLVYSTCSVCLEENEFLIEKFLRHFPEFRVVKAEPWIGRQGLRGLSECQRLFPHLHKCNGFFVAKLTREE